MPIYEFFCEGCNFEFEELVTMSEERPSCPRCGSDSVERKISAPSPTSRGAFPFKPLPPRPMANTRQSCPSANACAGCSKQVQ